MNYSALSAYIQLLSPPTSVTAGTQVNYLCNQAGFRYLCNSNCCCSNTTTTTILVS